MVLNILTCAGVECERLYLIAIHVKKVKLGELNRGTTAYCTNTYNHEVYISAKTNQAMSISGSTNDRLYTSRL